MKFDFKEFIKSKGFKTAVFIVAFLVLALLIFQAGEFVGYRKATFSYSYGERYYREAFGRPDRRMMGMGGYIPSNLPEIHGTVGKIIKVSLPSLVVEGRDNIEENVVLDASTTIKMQGNDIKASDLKVDDSIMVIGSPNDKSEIEARLIRVLPPPPAGANN